MSGSRGCAGYLIPVMLLLCGALLWFNPAQRAFYSLLAIVLALGSWITSNLGGFFIGMLLALVGGALAFAWTTNSENEQLSWYQGNPQILQMPQGRELVLRPTAVLPPGRAEESPAGGRALSRPHPLEIAAGSSDSPGIPGVVTSGVLADTQQAVSLPSTDTDTDTDTDT